MLRFDYYNRVDAQELLADLECETILMQGPMGSLLMSEPDAEDIPPAFWNLAEPQTVQRLHQLYVAAGAQVLLTNTFQATAPALERAGIARSMEEVNRAAVDSARKAGRVFVVGSMGPCGIEWSREDSPEYRAARAAYREQASALFEAGVAAVMLETFSSIRELDPALAGTMDVADGMPVFVSFAVDNQGCLLGDGLTIEGAVVHAEKRGVASVGVNCCSLEAADEVLPRLRKAARTPVSVRPNVGDPFMTEDASIAWPDRDSSFARRCVRWRATGANLVGCCCGGTPATTAAMSDALS